MSYSSKQVKSFIKFAQDNGFELVRRTKHFVFRQAGMTVTVSKTPSCPHALANARADIRRAKNTLL